MAHLALRNIEKRFGAVSVIHGISFDVEDGEFVVFVGPSGCGKSTLLRMICGLESVSSGDVEIDGQVMNSVPAARRGLAMVFQSYALYPHMTVYQNMAFGLENLATPQPEIERRVAEAARMLKLDAYLQRKPTALSGGQRQRVAIGRAIVREPRIFLFDEPLSNLDAELRVEMRSELSALHRRLGATSIYVTHDQTEAMTMADKIVVLRAGRVEQVGAPLALYNAPANKFVAGFIGSPRMNFFPATVMAMDAAGITLDVPGVGVLRALATGTQVGAAVSVGIRPEHIALAGTGDNDATGAVASVEQLGGLSYIRLAAPDLVVQAPGQTGLRPGDTATLHLPIPAIHVFDAEERALPKTAA